MAFSQDSEDLGSRACLVRCRDDVLDRHRYRLGWGRRRPAQLRPVPRSGLRKASDVVPNEPREHTGRRAPGRRDGFEHAQRHGAAIGCVPADCALAGALPEASPRRARGVGQAPRARPVSAPARLAGDLPRRRRNLHHAPSARGNRPWPSSRGVRRREVPRDRALRCDEGSDRHHPMGRARLEAPHRLPRRADRLPLLLRGQHRIHGTRGRAGRAGPCGHGNGPGLRKGRRTRQDRRRGDSLSGPPPGSSHPGARRWLSHVRPAGWPSPLQPAHAGLRTTELSESIWRGDPPGVGVLDGPAPWRAGPGVDSREPSRRHEPALWALRRRHEAPARPLCEWLPGRPLALAGEERRSSDRRPAGLGPSPA